MVAIFAHPDDEAFGPGGTLALYSKTCEVHVITITSGDAGGDQELGKLRLRELDNSCKVLGVKSIQCLCYTDGSLCNNLYHSIAKDLQKILDELKPDTILTFDSGGVSGHLDHIAAAMISLYLYEHLPYLKQIMLYCEKKGVKKMVGDYFVYFPEGKKVRDIDLSLDVSSVYEAKIKAMYKHVSQKDDCDWIIEKMGSKLKTENFLLKTK